VSAPVVIMGGAFGVSQASEDDDTAAWFGGERLVSVEYEVGDFVDMGEVELGEEDPYVVHVEHVEVMR